MSGEDVTGVRTKPVPPSPRLQPPTGMRHL